MTRIGPFKLFSRLTLAFALLAGGLHACAESSDPTGEILRDPSEVEALAIDTAAVDLLIDSLSFYAVYGEKRKVELFYQDSSGQQGERLLRFELDKKSLHRYPDGTRFGHGDSVLITIKVTNPEALQFDFEPSGLEFDRQDPGELEIRYRLAMTAPGPNEGNLAIWVQEQGNQPYKKLHTRVDVEDREVEADVPGFSKYAVAY